MKRIFINNGFFRILFPIVYGIIVYLLILLINNSINMLNESFLTQEVYISIILTYMVMESNRLLIKVTEKYTLSLEKIGGRIVILIISSTVLSIIVVSLLISAYFNYVIGFTNFSSELTYFNIIFLVTTWLYQMVYISNSYLHKENEEKLESEYNLRETVQKELSTFKNDINPTLLYESLESLITLVHKDPIDAEDYIDHMSSAYRYILSNKQNEFVDLRDDLKAVNNLLYLLNLRNHQNINFITDIKDDEMLRQVIPGTLPGLVEYIIRKTIINDNQPLEIICFIENDGYLNLKYQANERLYFPDEGADIVEKLQHSYAYFSDKPVVKVDAFGESYIKIPALELSNEEIAI